LDEIGWACYTCGRVQKCVRILAYVALLRNVNNKKSKKKVVWIGEDRPTTEEWCKNFN
jgi:anaerobic ribonucleoside-triphosphate reductase